MVSKEEIILISQFPLIQISRILLEQFLMTDNFGQSSQIHFLNFIFESPLRVSGEDTKLGIVFGIVNRMREGQLLRSNSVAARDLTQNHF